jgi:indolepyruvate ferredoxin oxidoreductase
MLRIVRHCKWLRKLPGWHRREVAFRDWYVGLLSRVNLTHDAAYAQAVRVFRCPEEVTGYREVRYPKQDRVREAIESELTRQVMPPPESPATVLDALRAPVQT